LNNEGAIELIVPSLNVLLSVETKNFRQLGYLQQVNIDWIEDLFTIIPATNKFAWLWCYLDDPGVFRFII